MKPQHWMIIILLVLVGLFIAIHPHGHNFTPMATQDHDSAPDQMKTTSNKTPSPTARSVAGTTSDIKKFIPGAFEREAKKGNHPIEFYGQTVDQNGQPLSGVQVRIVVPYLSLTPYSKKLEKVSDSQGLFDVHDVTGDAVDVESMSKDGYTLEPMSRGFGTVTGALGSPVIFRLWRNDIKEPLVKGTKVFNLIADGRPYVISITNGLVSEGELDSGDIKVWVTRPSGVKRGQHFDWSCGVQVINGGLCLEPELSSAMYVAPTNGYSNIFTFAEASTRNGWGPSTGSRRFYVNLNNGREFGRITVDISSYQHHQESGAIRIEYANQSDWLTNTAINV